MLPDTSAVLPVAIFAIRIASPALVFLATLSLISTRPLEPQSPSPITSVVVATRIPRRALILTFLSLTSLTYLLDGLAYVAYAVLNKTWPQRTGLEINAILGLAGFAGLAALGAWKDINGVEFWSRKRVKSSIGLTLVLDIAQVVLLGITVARRGPHPICRTPYSICVPDLLHFVLPAFRVLILLPLFVALLIPRIVYQPTYTEEIVEAAAPTDSTLLLSSEDGAQASAGLSPFSSAAGEVSKYGTFSSTQSTGPTSGPTTRAHSPAPGEPQKLVKPEIVLDPSWTEIVHRIGRLAPYLWPTKSAPLQLLAGLCILLLILGRAVNVLLPLSLGELVRTFEEKSGRSPWLYLFGYVGLRFLQSGGGIAALRDSLWAPVMQYSDREMSQLSFDHLLNLSFAFHMRRKTGEILRILDRGSAVNRTFELILFNIIPTFFDIIIALVVFCVMFDWTLSAVIFVVMFAYVAASVVLTRYRTKLRREMNDRDVVTRGIHTDCLLNYETVKYFGGEQHEGERYRDAIRQYQSLEYKVMVSLNLLNLVQNFIITLGLLVGSMIVALRVTRGQSSTSDFVIFITYLSQLYGPLNNLGFVYRSVNQSLVDTERLLKLLNEPSDVNDSPDAPDLIVDNGEVEFENVSFSYDGRTTALNGVSFKVPKGSSVALVGESGAGKSTVLRLLYRFYDLKPGEGRILIDGQDIRDVTQGSLRKAIGVVPQDSVLFNSSIGYNIGYGKFGASQDDIEIAAQAAQMHERILSFPDGYDTKVGERGVRLSGGEKQRVAIARTLLKNPPILLLDEATSALDTSTEKDIQKALQNLQRGRSSLSIAHRLSTIASADIILVLKDGQIAEQGSHKELLALDGVFASMWADQISSSEDPAFIAQPDKDVADGYDIGQIEAETQATETESQPAAQSEGAEQATIVDSPQVISVPLENVDDVPAVESEDVPAPEEPPVVPLKDTEAPISFPSSDAPTAFPSTEPEAPASSAPLAFPTSDDSRSQQAHSERAPSQPHAPGVTFGASVGSPPSRTGTPDPEAEPKRRRIGSQNFQRLARRISVTARSGTVSNIPFLPGLKRDASTVSASSAVKDEGAESSARNSNDSPAGSISSDPQTGKKKKEKKEKKRMSFI